MAQIVLSKENWWNEIDYKYPELPDDLVRLLRRVIVAEKYNSSPIGATGELKRLVKEHIKDGFFIGTGKFKLVVKRGKFFFLKEMGLLLHVGMKNLKRDLLENGISLCLVRPLSALIENRHDKSFKAAVEPFVVDAAREELSGGIVIDSSEKYEIWVFWAEGYSLFLVPKF